MPSSIACPGKMNEHLPWSGIGIKITPCGGYRGIGRWAPTDTQAPISLEAYGAICAELDKLGQTYV